jgi:hypothetical protein
MLSTVLFLFFFNGQGYVWIKCTGWEEAWDFQDDLARGLREQNDVAIVPRHLIRAYSSSLYSQVDSLRFSMPFDYQLPESESREE